MSYFDVKVVLIAGGNDSFGKKSVARILKEYKPEKVIIYSWMHSNSLKCVKSLRHLGTGNPMINTWLNCKN